MIKKLRVWLDIPFARHVCFVCCALTVAICVGTGGLRAEAALPALHTQGQKFVDPNGREVVLHGVNIGGWLVTEGWMCGDKQSDRFMLERLESRFGSRKAAALMNIWYNNWLTPADLDRIHGCGFNVVRVPFGYRNLQDAQGNWIRNANGSIDFSRFDWIVHQAAARNMYVIFDLHIWAGQQQDYNAISKLDATGDSERAKAAVIWSAVARHYRGNPSVAAFDLFNEPQGSPNDTLQRVSYEAVRKQDPRRIIIGEAMYYTNFSDHYWTNAVWSGHYPTDNIPGDTVDAKVASWASKFNLTNNSSVPAPIFIGEMKSPADNQQSAQELVAAMKNRDWSWAVWCYKTVNMGGWGAFDYDASAVHYDSATDSYNTLATLWSTQLTQWQHPGKPASTYTNQWWIAGYR